LYAVGYSAIMNSVKSKLCSKKPDFTIFPYTVRTMKNDKLAKT